MATITTTTTNTTTTNPQTTSTGLRPSSVLPSDIIRLICQHILSIADPNQPELSVDPFIRIQSRYHDYSPANSHSFNRLYLEPQPILQVQQTLRSLCLVSKQWNSEARKVLWQSGIRFGLPKSFETVVKAVDPIGIFFDGGVEPDWLKSPPASRTTSPRALLTSQRRQPQFRLEASELGYPHNTRIAVSTTELEEEHEEAVDSRSFTLYRPRSTSRRSISLKRQAGTYILQPHVSLDAKDGEDEQKTEALGQSLGPVSIDESDLRSGRTLQRRANRRQTQMMRFESSISPIRGIIEIETISQAFRRTSIPSPRRSGHPLSPSAHRPSETASIQPQIADVSFENGQGEETDEFIFDQSIDDLFNPGPFIKSISFSKYRSHGMRRSVAEGHQTRFVTPERLLRLLKSTRSRYSGLEENFAGEDLDEDELLRRGKLEAVGFSEYMDSAISKSVLDEMFLRGGVESEYETLEPWEEDLVVRVDDDHRGRKRNRKQITQPISHYASPHHSVPAPVQEPQQGYSNFPKVTSAVMHVEDVQHIRIEKRFESSLMMETPVEAVDLCGCISSKFRESLQAFIEDHSLRTPYRSDREDRLVDSQIRVPDFDQKLVRSTRFPFLTRLGLSQMLILSDLELSNLVSGFVNLIDLDISQTRAGPIVLHTLQLMKKGEAIEQAGAELGTSPTKKRSFRRLNLGKCRGMTEESLLGFLCGNAEGEEGEWEDPETSIGGLEELSIYGDLSLPNGITSEGLKRILRKCPCLRTGQLRALDLSSVRIAEEDLEEIESLMVEQPRLIQFGIGSCANIDLKTIQRLLTGKMKKVEVIDISFSCLRARERLVRAEHRRTNGGLNPISAGRLHEELIDEVCGYEELDGARNRKTNLRVIELEEVSRRSIKGGADDWKIALGKGQRGWYVDLSVTVRIESDEKGQKERKVIDRKLSDQDRNRTQSLRLEESLERMRDLDLELIKDDDIGWMSRKLEILNGSGFLGRQDGLYGFYAFA